jgi:hypothetical protein
MTRVKSANPTRRQWVDTDDQLDYRLAYYYNLDAFNARWTWLTDRQVGMSTFEDVLLPHDSSNLGSTRVRCVAFDDDGAFGYSATTIPVAAHADLAAAVEQVFVVGDHTEHIWVFPAALRRMQQQDKARHAANTGRRRRGLLALTVGAELHKALKTVRAMLDRSAVPSPKLRDAALELMETYVATSASDASNLPAQDLTPVIARTAHDWPDGETEAGTAPGGATMGSWARLTAAYGAAARRHGTERAGVNSARVLRGSAAADAAGDETCNEPASTRAVKVDNTAERLFMRATYSGTPAGYHAELARLASPGLPAWPAWPAEVPKFNITGDFQTSTSLWKDVPEAVVVADAKPLVGGCSHFCALNAADGAVYCWGYGGFGQLGTGAASDVGDAAGEMGASLAAVNIGAGRRATQLAAGCHHSCAVLDDGAVKCWGLNDKGQLGVGDALNRGDGGAGGAIAAVDLGTGRKAIQITAGNKFTCALLDNRQLKCWGENDKGQCGQGSSAPIGDGANELGDFLKPIALFAADSPNKILRVYSSTDYSCAVVTTNAAGTETGVKCWGGNSQCKANNGNLNSIGRQSGEMGADLVAVNLPTGRVVKQLALSGWVTCAIVTGASPGSADELVCWGHTYMMERTSQCYKSDGDGYLIYPLKGAGGNAAAFPTHAAGGNTHICVTLSDGSVVGRCKC